MKKAKIAIIYVGGTIGGNFDSSASVVVKDFRADSFKREFLDSIERILPANCQISNLTSPFVKFSEDITPEDWSKLATTIFELAQSSITAIIVLHGTDTMAYSTAAMSFMIKGLRVPIIFTGANRPFLDREGDAQNNIADSIIFSLKGYPGIFLSFAGSNNTFSKIHLGTRVRKVRYKGNDFSTVNGIHLAEIRRSHLLLGKRIAYITDRKAVDFVKKRNIDSELTLDANLRNNIGVFKLYPGFQIKTLEDSIKSNCKAIIFEVYGTGTACVRSSKKYNLNEFFQDNKSAINNIPMFMITQCVGGIEDIAEYPSSRILRENGVISLRDMILEAAIPKLMWILGKEEEPEKIRSLMQSNVVGEIGGSE